MILVSGATGFLGSELVRQLHKRGDRVRALKRKESVIPDILKGLQGIEWANADLLDYFSLEDAFEGITRIYHCAATVSFQASDKKKMLRTNVEGTSHIVDLCLDKGIDKLVYVSSVAALGEAKHGQPTTEKDHWEVNGQRHGYSLSKYESEMEVWRGMAEGLNAVIVNPSIIIGKNAGDKGSGQLFRLVRSGLNFYTTGSCGLVDTEDVAKAMIMLMNSNIRNERFIINAENISYKDLFTQAAASFGLNPPRFEARRWMLAIVWRSAWLVSLFTGKKHGLTRDIARSAFRKIHYSSKKLLNYFPDFTFKPVKKSIEEIASSAIFSDQQ